MGPALFTPLTFSSAHCTYSSSSLPLFIWLILSGHLSVLTSSGSLSGLLLYSLFQPGLDNPSWWCSPETVTIILTRCSWNDLFVCLPLSTVKLRHCYVSRSYHNAWHVGVLNTMFIWILFLHPSHRIAALACSTYVQMQTNTNINSAFSANWWFFFLYLSYFISHINCSNLLLVPKMNCFSLLIYQKDSDHPLFPVIRSPPAETNLLALLLEASPSISSWT